jgi:hypothetical protein
MINLSDKGVHRGMWVGRKAHSSVNVNVVLVVENA